MQKKWTILSTLLVLAIIVLSLWTVLSFKTIRIQNTQITFAISAKQQKIIHQYLQISQKLLDAPVIVNTIIKSNKKNRSLTKEQIITLDNQWKHSQAKSSFITHFSNNPCAQKLQAFQRTHPEFVEIFVTDQWGLNVCQTNKTSDYYQADEVWWQKSYANGTGLSYSGTLEYDKSSASVVIPLYVPIREKENNKTIGIAKLLLTTASIQ